MGGPGDWTHMLAGPICFNKLDRRDWKGPFGLNDTRAQQGKNLGGPWLWSWLTFPTSPAPYLFRCLVLSGYIEADGRGGSSGEDDYPVKLNVMIWTWPVTGGVICCLSERRQTTETGLTITPVKYTHVVDFCVKVYSVSSAIKLIMHCLKYTPGASASFSHQSVHVWVQKGCKYIEKFTVVHNLSIKAAQKNEIY